MVPGDEGGRQNWRRNCFFICQVEWNPLKNTAFCFCLEVVQHEYHGFVRT